MRELLKVFKALADPTRVQILMHLASGNLCVGALAQRLRVTPSAVSQHLRILREAGLVDGDKRGYWVHYSVERDRLRLAAAEVAKFFADLDRHAGRRGEPASGCPRRGTASGERAGRRGRAASRSG